MDRHCGALAAISGARQSFRTDHPDRDSVSLRWQTAAWISHIRREHAGRDGKFYVDQPPVPWQKAARNIAILAAASLLAAFLLEGQFGLSFWQILIMLLGFNIFYQDTRFFGAAVTYIITATGIAIRFVPGHIDYRLFLSFREISRIEKSTYQKGQTTGTSSPGSGIQLRACS